MKVRRLSSALATSLLCLAGQKGCPVKAEPAVPAAEQPGAPQPAAPQSGQAAFEAIKKLAGRWEAPVSGNGPMVDTFRPFAFGTAVLAEEWLGGQQITSTVFYMVGSELRADHYCDYKNQPRYVAKPTSDPSIIDLEFREATNLDTHPHHFHSTTWHLIDATHMTQDWHVEGGPKGNGTVHMEFVRRE
jgi:hypothetical protein